MVSDATLELWSEYQRAAIDSRFIPGFPGRPDGNATYTYFSEARPGKIYVRMYGQESFSIHEATNRGQVPLNPNLKVWMIYENGELCIDHADPVSLRLLYGNSVSTASAVYDALRTQQGPSLLPPFMVYPTNPTGLSVTVAPGWYGALQRFPDGAVQTITLVPTATSGKTAWVVVTIDRSTRVLAQWLGPDEDASSYTISESTLPDITYIGTPTASLAVAAILLPNGATSVLQSSIVPLEEFNGNPAYLTGLTLTHDLTVPAGVNWLVVGDINTNGYTLTTYGEMTTT